MNELYINGQQIELKDEKIYLSSKVNDIASPEIIKSSITQTFNIYKTDNNLRVFEYLGLNDTDFPYRDVECQLLMNGLHMFKKGRIGSIENDNGFWKVVLKEGNSNFFDEIEGYSIRDLDLSDLDHEWNFANVVNTFGNTDFIYCLIDWGVMADHNTYVRTDEVYPCIFESLIWDRIFSKTYNPALSENWSFSGEIFSDVNFTKAMVPTIDISADDNLRENMEIASRTSAGMPLSDPGTNVDVIEFDTLTSADPYGLLQAVNIPVYGVKDVYYVKSEGYYTVSSVIYYDLTAVSVRFNLYSGSRSILASAFLPTLGAQTYTITSERFYAYKDEYIYIIAEVGPLGSASINDPNNSTFSIDLVEIENTAYNFWIPLAANLPDISQKDFIKQRMIFNGLICQANILSNQLEFIKFEEILANRDKGNFYDWTNKIDTFDVVDYAKENFKKSYVYESFGKKNTCEFTEDQDVPDGLGNSYFTLNNKNYKGEKKYIESEYAATEMVSRLGIDYLTPIMKVLEDTGDKSVPETVIERKNKIKPRIVYLDQQSGITINYKDDSFDSNYNTDIPFCRFEDFSFENLLDYYADFIEAVEQPEILTVKVFLTLTDFNEFNHFWPVYLDSKWWFCPAINRFHPDKSTEIELLRLE